MFRRINLFRLFVPLCLIGIVLLGGGAKLWLIHLYGSDLPDRSQWLDGQAGVVDAWATGVQSASSDLAPARDYPVLARWISQGLLNLNGQWDNRLLVVANTFIHVFAVALLVALLAPRLTRPGIWLTSLAAAVLVAAPLNTGEILAGSALPDCLTLVLAIPAVWMLLEHRPASRDWWLGFALATATPFASHLSPALFAGLGAVTLARAWIDRPRRNVHAVNGAVAIAGLIGSLLLEYRNLGAALRWDAHWPQWIAQALAFPLAGWWWLLPLLHAPLAIWFWLLYRDPDRKQTLAPMLGIVSTAATLIAVHLCLERTPRDAAPTALASTMLLIDVAGVAWLWHHRVGPRSLRLLGTIAWTALVAIGLRSHTDRTLGGELPAASAATSSAASQLEQYCRDFDITRLAQPDVQQATGVSAEHLHEFLAPRYLQRGLPMSVRPRVRLHAGSATTPDFSTDVEGSGLPPALARAWVSGRGPRPLGGSVFVSRTLPPGLLPMLQFRVAGDLGTPRFPLALRSLETGETCTLVLEERTGARWKNVNLVRPPDPVVLVVGPAAADAWGAFSEPVEQGVLSWYTRKFAKNWAWFASGGAVALLAALAIPLFPSRRRTDRFVLTTEGTIRRQPAGR